jgi:hypothetical protein
LAPHSRNISASALHRIDTHKFRNGLENMR